MKDKLIKFYHWSNTWTGTIIIVLLIIFFFIQAFIIPSGSMKKTLLPGDALFAKKYVYGIPIPHIPWIEVAILPDFRGDGHLIDGPRPKRGDIVIFRYPLGVKKHFVKRCFAASGDKVIYNEEGFWLHPKEGDEYVKKHFKGFRVKEFRGELYVLNPYMKDHKGINYSNNNLVFFELKNRAEELAKLLGVENGYISADEFQRVINKLSGEYNILEIDVGLGAFIENGMVKYFYLPLKNDYFLMIGDNRDESFDSRFWGAVPYKLIVGKPWFIYMSFGKGGIIRWNRVGKTIDEIEKELKEGKKPYEIKGCEANL
jgi:signal peptidase I